MVLSSLIFWFRMVPTARIIYKQKNKACDGKTNRKGLFQTNANRKTKGKEWIFMYENIPEIMTLKECQVLLKVGKNTMLEILHTRQIEGFKIGNRWKVKKESLVEFIQNQ